LIGIEFAGRVEQAEPKERLQPVLGKQGCELGLHQIAEFVGQESGAEEAVCARRREPE
jgi:hypothetical protein